MHFVSRQVSDKASGLRRSRPSRAAPARTGRTRPAVLPPCPSCPGEATKLCFAPMSRASTSYSCCIKNVDGRDTREDALRAYPGHDESETSVSAKSSANPGNDRSSITPPLMPPMSARRLRPIRLFRGQGRFRRDLRDNHHPRVRPKRVTRMVRAGGAWGKIGSGCVRVDPAVDLGGCQGRAESQRRGECYCRNFHAVTPKLVSEYNSGNPSPVPEKHRVSCSHFSNVAAIAHRRSSPRPACGERSRASCERVRGSLKPARTCRYPPRPGPSLRSVSDLSPQAGRGEAQA
jgi:hypothetical protein